MHFAHCENKIYPKMLEKLIKDYDIKVAAIKRHRLLLNITLYDLYPEFVDDIRKAFWSYVNRRNIKAPSP